MHKLNNSDLDIWMTLVRHAELSGASLLLIVGVELWSTYNGHLMAVIC